MKRFIALSILCASICAAQSQTALRLLPFQGRLTDQNGAAVSNGVRLVQFKIFDVPSGGSPVWAGELHRTTVNGGLVNVLLGSKTPFSGVDFDRQLYLEITVDINGDNAITAADSPMLPRQAILPVVFAKEAANSRLLDGSDWSALFGTNDPANGTLLESKIRDGSVNATKLTSASLTSNQIAPRTINASLIAPATITSNQVSAGAIDLSNLAQQVAEALNPPGTVLSFAGATVPSGWLLCDGSPRYSTNYPRLFAAIGTAWGAGYTNGVQLGDFNVPDLRGVFLRGLNGGRADNYADPEADARTNSVLGGSVGNLVGSFQLDQFRAHTHTNVDATVGGGSNPQVSAGGGYDRQSVLRQTTPTGGAETRPKNAYVNYIIKY